VVFKTKLLESIYFGVPVSVAFFKDHNCLRNVNLKIESVIEIKPEESKKITIGIPNDKAVTQELTIVDTSNEILITVDISNAFFVPVVKIFSLELSKGVD
jgi:hypothetical protein